MPEDIPKDERKATPVLIKFPTTVIEFNLEPDPEEEDGLETIEALQAKLRKL